MVPLLVEEATTATVRGLYVDDPELLVWWGTEVEATSAIARLERAGQLTVEAATVSLERLGSLGRNWHEVQPGPAVRALAKRLLRVHELRAADALQLAAAVAAAEGQPQSLRFVCLDRRLSVAAQREGFPVLAGS